MSWHGTEVLSREEAGALLAAGRVGRLAVDTGEHPAILPVTYGVLDGDVVFCTAPGEKLIAAVLHREVAFEVDDADHAEHAGWSVNVVGPAEEVHDAPTLARLAALDVHPWAGGSRDRWVRIRAVHVTGRRVRAAAPA